LTWLEPVPYATPLYIYKDGNGIYPSFIKMNSKRFEELNFSPIYVLTKEPKKSTIRPEGNEDLHDYFLIESGVPQFRFEKYMGRCVPNPRGEKLEFCTLMNDLNLIRPQTLLDYLGDNARKTRKKYYNILFAFL